MAETWPIVFCTAHRDLPEHGRAWTRDKLADGAAWLIRERGMQVAVSGMARGVDLLWAAAALAAGVSELWAYVPFADQVRGWNARDRAEWDRIRHHRRTRVTVTGVIPAGTPPVAMSMAANRLLHARNDAMLGVSDAAVGVWVPNRFDGGTHAALLKAARRGLPGVHLNPDLCLVRDRLPTRAELEKHVLINGVCGCVAAVGTYADMNRTRAVLIDAGQGDWSVRPGRRRESVTAADRCERCATTVSPLLHPTNKTTR